MAFSFQVTRSELIHAANALQQQLESFEESTNQTRAAADHLASQWEGDARNTFVAEQEHNMTLYQEMQRTVADFIAALQDAEQQYGETDHNCAQLIRSH